MALKKKFYEQSGHKSRINLGKPVFYYDGIKFPFQDKQFDYIICSHVIEHVEDINLFLKELFRTGRKGYIEFPTVYYEYLYNFKVHLNFIRFDSGGNELIYLKKNDTHLDDFYEIQKFFHYSLEKGYAGLINDLKEFMFEGFEWDSPFKCRKASSLNELAFNESVLLKIKQFSDINKKQNLLIKALKKIKKIFAGEISQFDKF